MVSDKYLGTPTGTSHKVALSDEANGYVVADAIRLVPMNVIPQAKLYFIHTEHLNTPRLVADETQKTVWKWEQQEPFGFNAANDDPVLRQGDKRDPSVTASNRNQ